MRKKQDKKALSVQVGGGRLALRRKNGNKQHIKGPNGRDPTVNAPAGTRGILPHKTERKTRRNFGWQLATKKEAESSKRNFERGAGQNCPVRQEGFGTALG